MALSDSKKTSEYDFQSGLGAYNNSTDVFKWVILTDSYSVIDATATAVGIANYTKVASAGLYVQDTTLASKTWTKSGAVSTLDYDSFNYGADGSNPTTGKTIAVYNDTHASKHVFKFIDLTTDGGTTPADTTLGLNFTVNASGSGTVTTS
ncbi:MAG TPA: hypothetical protein EYN54_00145 [Methylococcaceae bacterium]|nr:hypothetical protein [Methylococcaceae bacterium]